MTLIPNSWQTPNDFMDKYNPYLTSEEWRILSYACRHILGWQDKIDSRMRRISISMFEKGYGEYPGCGLKRKAIINALNGLSKYGLLIKVGEATQAGQMWKIPSNETEINLAGLQERQASNKRTAVSRTHQARQHKKGGVSDTPVVSGTHHQWLVGHTRGGVSDTLNQSQVQSQVQSQNTFPTGEPSIPPSQPPFERFIEAKLDMDTLPKTSLEIALEDPKMQQTLLDLAVCGYFEFEYPKSSDKPTRWSHMRMLGNFFTGRMKPDAKKKSQGEWYDNQFSDDPFTPVEIVAMSSWWEYTCPDATIPSKPATIREKVPLFRLAADYDDYIHAGELWLNAQLDKLFPKPQPEDDPPASPEEIAAFFEGL